VEYFFNLDLHFVSSDGISIKLFSTTNQLNNSNFRRSRAARLSKPKDDERRARALPKSQCSLFGTVVAMLVIPTPAQVQRLK
jgi:hypothetical protein